LLLVHLDVKQTSLFASLLTARAIYVNKETNEQCTRKSFGMAMWKARSLEEHQIHAGGHGFKPVKPDKVDGKKKSSNQYGCDIEPYYLHIDIVLLFYQYTTDLLLL